MKNDDRGSKDDLLVIAVTLVIFVVAFIVLLIFPQTCSDTRAPRFLDTLEGGKK